MRLIYLSLLFSGMLLSGSLFSQTKKGDLITVNLEQAHIDTLVQIAEEQTDYHFFYDKELFDSLRITSRVVQKPLPDFLRETFVHTDFKFAIDSKRNIFLTRGTPILVALPENLVVRDKAINVINKKNEPITVRDFLAPEASSKGAASLENKLYQIGVQTESFKKSNISVAGTVKDSKTGEPVIGASVYIEFPRIGVSTDQFGYYSLNIPAGRHVLNIRSIGMRDAKRQIAAYGDGRLDIEVLSQVRSLKEVVISAEKVANIRNTQMGVEKLSMATIKQVPTVFGEPDILRVVLTLPGVKSVGESSTGFNVRGGAIDQNLILYNDATIYNPSHLFGFFSAFNSEAIKDIELYKSSIPSKYGGRISSVLDVTSREGNNKKFAGSAGIGLLTSRLNVEGPIIKDRTSFMIGARTTYSDWLLGWLPAKTGYRDSKASFSDIDLHLTHKINDKNSLFFTGYLSKDKFNLNSDTTYSYNNNNFSLKWKHNYNNKFNSVVTAGTDGYKYDVNSTGNPINAYRMGFDISQTNFKTDFTYYLNPKNSIDFGISSIYYKLHPGKFIPNSEESVVSEDVLASEQALESAIYLSDRIDVSPLLSLNVGLRYSLFNYLGPKDIYTYAEGIPKNEYNVLDSVSHTKGDFIKNYGGPEYRISARYILSDKMSLKAGFNSLRQYIHMLSNTTAITPTDIWKLSDPNIKPQAGQQLSLGLYRNIRSNTIETSVEAYYKWLKNYLDYKSGATVVLNHHIETDVVNSEGKAYGVELMVKKTAGKLNGWMSYTYSRTMLKMDDPTEGEIVNEGKFYPANYDKPHDFTFVGNFKVSHRFNASLNVTYSTGRPITLPIGKYYYGGAERLLYSDRNQHRIPDYFRSDFSLNIDGNHKVHQWTHSSWTLGVYNITGRHNAYSTYFVTESGSVNGYKLSIFGTAIPFINYNIRL